MMKRFFDWILLLTLPFFAFVPGVFAEQNQGINAEIFQDIRPPVNPPFDKWLWLILLITLFLLAAGWAVWKFVKKRRANKPVAVAPRSPYQIACERLSALLKKDLPGQGLVKEYFIEISDILRRYVEGRFALKAPELTTPEFLEKIKRSDQLQADHKQLLKEFLVCCDLVKFAKYGPSASEIQESEDLVMRFVEDTRPVIHSEKEAEHAV